MTRQSLICLRRVLSHAEYQLGISNLSDAEKKVYYAATECSDDFGNFASEAVKGGRLRLRVVGGRRVLLCRRGLGRRDEGPELIFTRGAQPWSAGAPEGKVLFERARQDLVPEGMLALTPPVENTAQEAAAVAEMLENGNKLFS